MGRKADLHQDPPTAGPAAAVAVAAQAGITTSIAFEDEEELIQNQAACVRVCLGHAR